MLPATLRFSPGHEAGKARSDRSDQEDVRTKLSRERGPYVRLGNYPDRFSFRPVVTVSRRLHGKYTDQNRVNAYGARADGGVAAPRWTAKTLAEHNKVRNSSAGFE